MESWEILLSDEMVLVKDMTPIIACTLTADEMRKKFLRGYGINGQPFTAWSETRVYFPAFGRDFEWVASVPRDPCDEHTFHIGG